MSADAHEPATWHTVTPSALGELTLVRDAGGLRGLYFPHHWYQPSRATFGPQAGDGFDAAICQLTGYLAGTRREFDLPLAARGDEFQRRVWEHVRQIPYGATVSYGELAARIGAEADGAGGAGDVTAQQVGAAVGRNPMCILIPCHRVVGRDGKLTGYAGGIARKRHLLELERDQAAAAAGAPLQQALLPAMW
jgi:methylated-DNA-[protein]-cysteine S-methyltransferase